MILTLTQVKDKSNYTFKDVVWYSLQHTNIYIRRAIWPNTLYAKITEGDNMEILTRKKIIDNNCDDFWVDAVWSTSIDIEGACADDWEIYQAIVG